MNISTDVITEDRLLAWRPQFPILATSSYLISNSLGAMPAGVYEAMRGYAEAWGHEGVRAWEQDWWLLPERVAAGLAPLLGAPADCISTHQNVTIASAVIASCLDYGPPRDKVVCSELNFPSVVQLYRQQERRGARLHLVECPDGLTVPLDAMLAAIDEQTLLVPISHVIFKSSFVQDVKAIVARAHEVGAMVVLDTYQSAGIMPLDLVGLQVDFAVGGVLKWLCGGPGTAYLYVQPQLAGSLEPALTGWFARARPFDFDPRDASHGEGSRRFLNGTTHVPALSAALPGLEILGQLDMNAVRAKSVRQTSYIIAQARERGWRVNSPLQPEQRAGHVSVAPPNAADVAAGLLQRRVMIDHRPGAGIRLAPHFYTSDEEIDRAFAEMDDLVMGVGAWRQ